MKIEQVNGNHMAQPEGETFTYPQFKLEKAFVGAFADEHEGEIAFEKVKRRRITVRSDVHQWVAGMNSIISTWNQMPSHMEADIRRAFAPELA